MKLYTIVEDKEVLITSCNNNLKVGLKEYSYKEYLSFIEEVKKYYLHEYHYWYTTDMSDRDEGSNVEKYTINHSNMVIRDNKVYGVLVKTGNNYPKYYICTFEKGEYYIDLAGGYNKNSFSWTIKENPYVINDYLIIREYISYSLYEKNNKKVLSIYRREVIGLFKEDAIFENDLLIGFKKDDQQFIISDPSTYQNIKTNNDYGNDNYNIDTLVKVDEEFLNNNIFDVSYEDFRNGNYQLFTKVSNE
ncbi:MAG: hypothetical protein E7177_03665 [Erysipelotrichaceae bacterium]|nr:hypothetical protein [Erysipelotrichaceae bacterium]